MEGGTGRRVDVWMDDWVDGWMDEGGIIRTGSTKVREETPLTLGMKGSVPRKSRGRGVFQTKALMESRISAAREREGPFKQETQGRKDAAGRLCRAARVPPQVEDISDHRGGKPGNAGFKCSSHGVPSVLLWKLGCITHKPMGVVPKGVISLFRVCRGTRSGHCVWELRQ